MSLLFFLFFVFLFPFSQREGKVQWMHATAAAQVVVPNLFSQHNRRRALFSFFGELTFECAEMKKKRHSHALKGSFSVALIWSWINHSVINGYKDLLILVFFFQHIFRMRCVERAIKFHSSECKLINRSLISGTFPRYPRMERRPFTIDDRASGLSREYQVERGGLSLRMAGLWRKKKFHR